MQIAAHVFRGLRASYSFSLVLNCFSSYASVPSPLRCFKKKKKTKISNDILDFVRFFFLSFFLTYCPVRVFLHRKNGSFALMKASCCRSCNPACVIPESVAAAMGSLKCALYTRPLLFVSTEGLGGHWAATLRPGGQRVSRGGGEYCSSRNYPDTEKTETEPGGGGAVQTDTTLTEKKRHRGRQVRGGGHRWGGGPTLKLRGEPKTEKRDKASPHRDLNKQQLEPCLNHSTWTIGNTDRYGVQL